MRNALLAVSLLLAGCAARELPVHGEMPGRICNSAGAEGFVGRPGTSETGAAILKATHSAILRWAPPGVMLTMDYSASRVTVRLGPDGKVTAINCG